MSFHIKLLILCLILVSFDSVQTRRTGSTGDHQEFVVDCPNGLKWCGRFYGCLKICPRKRRDLSVDCDPPRYNCELFGFGQGSGCKTCCINQHCQRPDHECR